MLIRGTRSGPFVQYAALPFRLRQDGAIEVLLITTRGGSRWIVPKGWPIRSKPPHECAAQEAFEEAGVVGNVAPNPIGWFRHPKHVRLGGTIMCEVALFPLEVTSQKKSWPEMAERSQRWFSVDRALQAISDPELREAVQKFAQAKAAADAS